LVVGGLEGPLVVDGTTVVVIVVGIFVDPPDVVGFVGPVVGLLVVPGAVVGAVGPMVVRGLEGPLVVDGTTVVVTVVRIFVDPDIVGFVGTVVGPFVVDGLVGPEIMIFVDPDVGGTTVVVTVIGIFTLVTLVVEKSTCGGIC
jgi:hypothetical protein